jgi:hypothetical protein
MIVPQECVPHFIHSANNLKILSIEGSAFSYTFPLARITIDNAALGAATVLAISPLTSPTSPHSPLLSLLASRG